MQARMWPPVRTCTNMAGLKVLFQGHGAESVKEARSAGFTGHQRMRCPGVEGGRRQEENDLIDSFRRTRNVRTIRFFMHFHTGQKHLVSARRSQHSQKLLAHKNRDMTQYCSLTNCHCGPDPQSSAPAKARKQRGVSPCRGKPKPRS